MNRQEKIDYLNQLCDNYIVFGEDVPFDCFYYKRIKENNKTNFVITGYNKDDCGKSIFIDGIFTKIGDFAFKDNQIIEEVILGSGVKSIGKEAFSGCCNLKRVVCRQSLQTLSIGAFKNCINLKSIELGKNLREIDDYAFEGCPVLKEIELGSKVFRVGKGAFKNCLSLESVSKSKSFFKLYEETFLNCISLKEINLEDVYCIGHKCFKDSGIERVYVNFRLRDVESFAFDGCKDLKEVIFLNYSISGSFSVMTSGGNILFSDATWIGRLQDGTSFVIERTNL